jgi:hypothetical protein
MTTLKTVKNLSDKELVTRLHQLVGKEKSITLEILPHPACAGRAIISCASGN